MWIKNRTNPLSFSEEGCGEMLQACKPVSVTRRGVNAIIYLR